MKRKDYYLKRHGEHHPVVSLGLFFIVLGAALMVAVNDLLNLGSIREYFTWETALVFIGTLLLLNLKFTGGILFTALGTWFFIRNMDYEVPQIVRTIYWPGVIILLGLGFILSAVISRFKKGN